VKKNGVDTKMNRVSRAVLRSQSEPESNSALNALPFKLDPQSTLLPVPGIHIFYFTRQYDSITNRAIPNTDHLLGPRHSLVNDCTFTGLNCETQLPL